MEYSVRPECPFSNGSKTDTLDFGALEEELLGPLNIEEDGSHFVCTMTPMGEVFWTFFTPAQWRTICEIAALDDKEVETAVEEVIIEKYHRMKDGLGEND